MTTYRFRFGETAGVSLEDYDGPPTDDAPCIEVVTGPPKPPFGEPTTRVDLIPDGPDYWVMTAENWLHCPRPPAEGYDAKLIYGDWTRTIRVVPNPRMGGV